MRLIAFILFVTPVFSFSQVKKVDSASINKIVATIDRLSEGKEKVFTIQEPGHKKATENWKYFDDRRYSRIDINYTIDSPNYSIAYTEKYYSRAGKLIYSYQSEIFFTPREGIEGGTEWAGDFYFDNEKLIDEVTLGHGRSELDDWDPEKEILDKLKRRKKELASRL